MALTIRRVSRDEVPKSNAPGRVRKPSDFDDYMADAYAAWVEDADEGWFEVVYDGTKENFEFLVSELNRAAIAFSYVDSKGERQFGAGKSIRGGYDEEAGETTRNGDGDGVPAFWFQIRDKMKTGRRGKRRNADGTETEVDLDDSDTDGADGVEESGANMVEIEESIEAAKSSKRGRKLATTPAG